LQLRKGPNGVDSFERRDACPRRGVTKVERATRSLGVKIIPMTAVSPEGGGVPVVC
jgi:hypothetical protein